MLFETWLLTKGLPWLEKSLFAERLRDTKLGRLTQRERRERIAEMERERESFSNIIQLCLLLRICHMERRMEHNTLTVSFINRPSKDNLKDVLTILSVKA